MECSGYQVVDSTVITDVTIMTQQNIFGIWFYTAFFWQILFIYHIPNTPFCIQEFSTLVIFATFIYYFFERTVTYQPHNRVSEVYLLYIILRKTHFYFFRGQTVSWRFWSCFLDISRWSHRRHKPCLPYCLQTAFFPRGNSSSKKIFKN